MSKTIDLTTPEPRYVKVAAHLRHQLKIGAIKPGDRLPSFPEMKARHGISQATMERAHAILEKEGLIERRRGSGTFVKVPSPPSTGTIGIYGIAAGDARHIPYYVHLMQGLQRAAAAAGREILLLNEDSAIHSARVDGIVGTLNTTALKRLPPGMPCVSILVPAAGVTSVLSDDYDGIRQAIEHLVALGHQRIGLLAALNVETQRVRAFQETLMAAGIEPLSAWMHDLPVTEYPGAGYREWGYREMRRWLRTDWNELGCTALLAHNDYTAIGVMQALGESGLNSPHDVSVIGFDGTEVCDCFMPRVTSVEVALEEIGIRAMQALLDHINQPARNAEHIMLPTRLQVRESTATPAARGKVIEEVSK